MSRSSWTGPRRWSGLHAVGSGRGKPRRRARRDPRRRRAAIRPRQGDDRRVAGTSDLGAWLEQLVAESTGKEGKGLIPGRSRSARHARCLRRRPSLCLSQIAVGTRRGAGHGRRRAGTRRSSGRAHGVDDPYDLGEEFFRWEIATAVAGSILGINPFDQPDVEASKIVTRRLTAEYERTGALPARRRSSPADGIKLFTDEKNAAALRGDGRRGPRWRDISRRTSAGSARATTSRCSRTWR